MMRRFVLSAVAVSAAVLAIGGSASAHIDPDPTEAQAGSRLTVGFTVEHGCEGSPTVQLDMRLPVGVTDPAAEPVDGWDGSIETVDGDVIVTFAGGPLADDVEGTFSVTMTLPPTPDTTIYFPFVQRCEVGEIRWIGIPTEPGEELDEPAPAMALVGPIATVPTTVPVPEPTEPEATCPRPPSPAPPTRPRLPRRPKHRPRRARRPPRASRSRRASTKTATPEPARSCSSCRSQQSLGLGAFVVYRSRQARAGNPPDAD